MSTVEPSVAAPGPKVRTRLERFLSHPVAGGIAWAVTVGSIPLTICLYLRPPEHRDLRYMVHPEKTMIVREGQLSRLSVALDGKLVTRDISAAQVAFWNKGNQAIRRENVLEPLRLRTSPSVPIIGATIRRVSREVVRIQVDSTNFQRGELAISWNILERGDGAALQVVFAGGTDIDLVATATLEGQVHVNRLVPDVTPQTKYDAGEHGPFILLVVWSVGVALSLLVILVARSDRESLLKSGFWVPLAVAALISVFVLLSPESGPPFGF